MNTPEIQALFDNWQLLPANSIEKIKLRSDAEKVVSRLVKDQNPCVTLYGPAKEPGAKCKTCSLLIKNHHRSITVYKCSLRKLTRGKASDHKVSYPACSRYEEGKPEIVYSE